MERDLVTDPKRVAALADERWDENVDFRAFLKGELNWPDARLDALVAEIATAVAARIDCQSCGNCCRTMLVTLTGADAKRLARRLRTPLAEFEERYLATDEGSEKVIVASPCPFLEGSRCAVYEDRPATCRSFPHLRKREFRFRTLGIIQNASCCPIIFNTLERLKERVGFRRRSRSPWRRR
ncbi:MAG: YkgJ family cysteine cluster protein [Armatimonadetes bacterium]|nr:YkgJ family cysteine cluster protein [Armatimonadota bacterium]